MSLQSVRRRLEDFLGPRVYADYVPHRLQIPLRDAARHMGVSFKTFGEVWMHTDRLLVRTQFGGQPFTTKRDVEAAIVAAGIKPRVHT